MSIHRKLMTGCAVAVLGFGLAACGGGGDSSRDERDSLRMKIAELEAALPEGTELTPAAITQLTDDLTAATADVTRLMGELETAMDNSADETEIARLMGELETLMMRADITPAQVQALRDQITALLATTPEAVLALNQQITALTEQLGTATADVTRLEGELETALDNSADEAEIARLMGELETDEAADDACRHHAGTGPGFEGSDHGPAGDHAGSRPGFEPTDHGLDRAAWDRDRGRHPA
jgi:chromosome segregation ATPase